MVMPFNISLILAMQVKCFSLINIKVDYSGTVLDQSKMEEILMLLIINLVEDFLEAVELMAADMQIGEEGILEADEVVLGEADSEQLTIVILAAVILKIIIKFLDSPIFQTLAKMLFPY